MEDARLAVETGVDGLDVVIGTSSFLREHSHGKSMAYITKTALEVIEYIKSKGLEVRCEFTILYLPASSIPYTTSKSCGSSCLSNPISAFAPERRTIVRGTMSQDQEDSHVSNKNCARAQTAVLLQDMTFSSQ
jgi:hypothetical protein